MKKLIPLLAVVLAATACHSISVTTPGGATAKVTSFGQRTTIGSLTFGTNGVSVTGFNNDQASLIAQVFAAGVQAAKSGVVP